jgi:hypothetical protein
VTFKTCQSRNNPHAGSGPITKRPVTSFAVQGLINLMETNGRKKAAKEFAGGPALPQSAIKERRKSGAPCARKHNKREENTTHKKRFVALTQVANMDFPPFFVSQRSRSSYFIDQPERSIVSHLTPLQTTFVCVRPALAVNTASGSVLFIS